MSKVKFAIPKGSLEEATFKILEKSWTKVNRKSRTYRVFLDDPQISNFFIRSVGRGKLTREDYNRLIWKQLHRRPSYTTPNK